MDPALFARGLALGFTIAAAVGPISLLTIRRTLAHGRIYGLASGLGVAAADATFGAIAAFGLTAVTAVLVGGQALLRFAGGAFLIILAWRTMTSRPREVAAVADRPGLGGAFLSIFGLTMTNPMTILSFAALFAGLGVAAAPGAGAVASGVGPVAPAVLVAGVFCGSATWWLLLTTAVSLLRSRITVRGLTWVNRVSGVVLLVFAVAAIASAVIPASPPAAAVRAPHVVLALAADVTHLPGMPCAA
jgi:threonine/homoserine/homoserine lactone efflux protein